MSPSAGPKWAVKLFQLYSVPGKSYLHVVLAVELSSKVCYRIWAPAQVFSCQFLFSWTPGAMGNLNTLNMVAFKTHIVQNTHFCFGPGWIFLQLTEASCLLYRKDREEAPLSLVTQPAPSTVGELQRREVWENSFCSLPLPWFWGLLGIYS